VRVLLGTEVAELLGEQTLEAVAVEGNRTGARRIVRTRALFVFIGVTPCTGWLGGLVELDDHGFVRTGPGAGPAAGTVVRPEAGCNAQRWRPADQASLPPATSAAARPNVWPQPWAKGRWRFG
jgi:hypothetical protein